jgi:hypothetical protein
VTEHTLFDGWVGGNIRHTAHLEKAAQNILCHGCGDISDCLGCFILKDGIMGCVDVFFLMFCE